MTHPDPATGHAAPVPAARLRLPSRESAATALVWTARAGLLLTVALSPWRYRWTLVERPAPPVYGDYTNFLLFPSDLTLLAALIAWLAARWLRPGPRRRGPGFLSLPLAGLVALAWLGLPFAFDPALSFYHSLRLALLFGLYLAAIDLLGDARRLALAAGLLVLTQAPLGLMQVLKQHSLGLQSLGEYDLDPAWIGVSVVATGDVRLLRAYALTDHPNLLGGTLAFALFAIAAGFLEGKRPWRALHLAVFGLGLVGLLVTFSRAATLGLAAGMALYGFLLWRRRPPEESREWLALMLAGALFLAPFLAHYAPFVAARVGVSESFQTEPTERRSLRERVALHQATNQIFSEHALTGVGVGGLPVVMRERFPEFPYYYQPAHFVLLDAAAETGLFGALLLGLALVGPWLALVRLARRRQRLPHGLIAASGLLLALTVVGFFDYYPWLLQPGRLWQWLAWGLWARQYIDALHGAAHA